MKAKWELHDIKGGVRAKKPFTMGNGDMVCRGIRKGQPSYWIVSLDDGLILAEDVTAEQVCQFFNDNGSVPLDMLPIFEERGSK